jgi:hypothetical protein
MESFVVIVLSFCDGFHKVFLSSLSREFNFRTIGIVVGYGLNDREFDS